MARSRQELQQILEKNPDDNLKKIIKTELTFYVHTHKADRAGRPELFRLTNISTEMMVENLLILLSNEDGSSSKSSLAEITLPTNEDAFRVIQSDGTITVQHPVFDANEPCINLWLEGDRVRSGFSLGFSVMGGEFSAILGAQN